MKKKPEKRVRRNHRSTNFAVVLRLAFWKTH